MSAGILRLHRPELSKTERVERVTELADMVGLDERLRLALPRRLSGGQRQRVAIARALSAEPKVLVLDESVSALDVSIQAQILNLLTRIRASTGISYILISHDLAVIRQITQTCVVMQNGRIVERGLSSDILNARHAEYTKMLRASVPVPGWKPSRRMSGQSAGELAEV